MGKKTALILSGGGAKGAFQCGAEKYAREVKKYQWDTIAGVSVGALNGAMLASGKYQRLFEVWNTISNDKVYTGGFNLVSVLKILFGARSFFGNEPLRQLLDQEFDPQQIQVDLRIGAVSLITGEYVQFDRTYARLKEAILASTVMPVIWTPEDVSPEHRSMVDGGVRNITPIGDVLDSEPDEIVIINCSPETEQRLTQPPNSIGKIGLRTLDIMLNELFRSDVREFIRINDLVKQAGEHGITLVNPNNGKPYKYFDYKLIEPEQPLGDTLDFSQATIQNSLAKGVEQARKVLSKPNR